MMRMKLYWALGAVSWRFAGCDATSNLPSASPPSPFKGDDNPYKHRMTYRPLGKTGLRISALSYGAWLTFSENGQIGIQKAKDILTECVKQGINFFDNAESYGGFKGEAELVMGEALKLMFAEKIVKRSDLILRYHS